MPVLASSPTRTMNEQTTVNKAFPFLELPAEVRNMIYREALAPRNCFFLRSHAYSPKAPPGRDVASLDFCWYKGPAKTRVSLMQAETAVLSLRCVNRQVHEESSSILFHDAELSMFLDLPMVQFLSRCSFGLRSRNNASFLRSHVDEEVLSWIRKFRRLTVFTPQARICDLSKISIILDCTREECRWKKRGLYIAVNQMSVYFETGIPRVVNNTMRVSEPLYKALMKNIGELLDPNRLDLSLSVMNGWDSLEWTGKHIQPLIDFCNKQNISTVEWAKDAYVGGAYMYSADLDFADPPGKETQPSMNCRTSWVWEPHHVFDNEARLSIREGEGVSRVEYLRFVMEKMIAQGMYPFEYAGTSFEDMRDTRRRLETVPSWARAAPGVFTHSVG